MIFRRRRCGVVLFAASLSRSELRGMGMATLGIGQPGRTAPECRRAIITAAIQVDTRRSEGTQ
jgi:hypothetical protein